MTPRPYRLGQRKAATEETRARIVNAALELLREEGTRMTEFSIDAVARRANVVRMTVYYQFGARRGLLEAVFDELATRGLVPHLRAAFARAEVQERLDGLVAAFGQFWGSDRLVIRRLRSMAALDPELGDALRARDALRLGHMRSIVGQAAPGARRKSADELANVLHTLTSFETFDTLAGPTRTPEEVTPLVQRLARAALGAGLGIRE
jgi:AcrR family transcriptional regulator